MKWARLATLASAVVAVAAVSGCHTDEGWSGELAEASPELFQSMAYPVLMRDCAFSECHGAPFRFLQIFGPGRTRLDPATKTDDPPTEAELRVSYDRARSMLATKGRPEWLRLRCCASHSKRRPAVWATAVWMTTAVMCSRAWMILGTQRSCTGPRRRCMAAL